MNWVDITGCEGRYQVSDEGYVRSLPDVDHRGQFMIGKILKAAVTEKGYETVAIDQKTRKVHILVAEAFVENPASKPQINHEDGNKRNNRKGNLTWVTNSENQIHRYSVLKQVSRLTGRTGSRCANSKPVRSVNVKSREVTLFAGASDAARLTGVDASGICLAANGKLQTYKGAHWEWVV